MTGVMFFCIAEEAKPFVRKVSNHDWSIGNSKTIPPFYIVESQTCFPDHSDYKRVIADDQPYESEFIGCSPEQCQDWLRKEQYQHLWMDQDIVFIADERSAKDDTLLVKYYHSGEGIEFPDMGVTLPSKTNIWYEYRVDYKGADQIHTDLFFAEPDMAYPLYFQHQDKMVDERGVFDLEKAERIISGKEKLDV